MIDLIVTLVGSALGVLSNALVFPWSIICGIAGFLIAGIGAIRMYRTSVPYVHEFDEKSWRKIDEREFLIEIPKKLHGKSSPQTELQQIEADGSFATFMASIATRADGTVVVTVTGLEGLERGRIILT